MQNPEALIDVLIVRGIARLKTEKPAVTITDFLRIVQLADTDRRLEVPEVVWSENLPDDETGPGGAEPEPAMPAA